MHEVLVVEETDCVFCVKPSVVPFRHQVLVTAASKLPVDSETLVTTVALMVGLVVLVVVTR